jgi:hypothetical protein
MCGSELVGGAGAAVGVVYLASIGVLRPRKQQVESAAPSAGFFGAGPLVEFQGASGVFRYPQARLIRIPERNAAE